MNKKNDGSKNIKQDSGFSTEESPQEQLTSQQSGAGCGSYEETLISMTGISFFGEGANKVILSLPEKFIFYIKRLIIPFIAVSGLAALYYLRSIFLLFIISFFFAYTLNPFVDFVQKYLKNKSLSIIAVYMVLFSLFLILIIPAVANIVTEISDFGTKMQNYGESFKKIYHDFIESVQKSGSPQWLGEFEKYYSYFLEPGDSATKEVQDGYFSKTESTPANGYEVNIISIPTSEVAIAGTSEIAINYITKLNYFLRHNPKVEAYIMSMFEMLKDYLLSVSSTILVGLIGLTSVLIHYALVPLLGYYFLADFKNLWNGFCNSLPNKLKKQTVNLLTEIDCVLGMFLRGQMVVCLIVGTCFSVILFLIGIDFAFIIGPIAGILNIIYYLGPAIAFTMSFVISILKWGLTYKALYKIVILAILILATHLFDAFVMQPFIADKSFSIHPLTLMFILFIGFELYGLVGMFVAIPIYGVGKVLYKNFKIVYV